VFNRNFIVTSVLAGATVIAAGSQTLLAQDTYSGGAAVAYLPEEFVLGGANPIGVNYAFPGNPFTPLVNGNAVPLYDAVTNTPTEFVMNTTSTLNKDGSYSVSLTVQTSGGQPFVTDSTPLQVLTADGFRDATDFVIDLGNGYQLPGFPVDGVDVGSEPGNVFVDVEYWFTRLDGSENREFGDTAGPFLTPAGFVFAWGYDLFLGDPTNADSPRNIRAAGFIATFKPILPACPCPDLNGDCVVDGADLGLLLSVWGSCGKAGPGCLGDINDDGQVNGADLGLMLGGWGCTG
jgi:hypothetical protein